MESEIKENKIKSFVLSIWNHEKGFKILKFVMIFIIITASAITIKNEINYQFNASNGNTSANEENTENDNCNVYGFEIRSDLMTYIPPAGEGEALPDATASETIIYGIEQAENDDKIKAIILEVDSIGGYPLAGEEISNALKRAKKPTIALIKAVGASASYIAATGADRIFASKSSDVGGIGVTMSYLENVKKNQKDGLTYIPLSVGKFKDAGDPNRPLSQEEKNLFMRDINILYKHFIKMVAENRNLDIKKVESLADGSTMLGEMALQNGLIDQIGGLFEVREYLRGKIGAEPEICW